MRRFAWTGKLAVVVALTASTIALAAGSAVETWRVHEFALTSGKDYSVGGGDAVRLDVEFSNAKTGEKLVRPAFWDGGTTFRVRFAPPSPGAWVWRTTCKDESSLNGKMGGFLAESYSGSLAVYRHGFVRAESGRKVFVHADGTPFLYLGDMHANLYKMPLAASRGRGAKPGFADVLRQCVEQGFTVFQSEPNDAPFDLSDGRVDAADLPGLRLADKYYQAIADAGLVHANAELFPPEKMNREVASDWNGLARLGRYWSARFGAYPVMWTLGREVDNDNYAERGETCFNFSSNPWLRVANALHANDCYGHPLSGHQEEATHTTVSGAGTSAEGRTGAGVSIFKEDRVAKKAGHSWWAAQWHPTPAASVDWEIPRDYLATDRPAVCYAASDATGKMRAWGARAQGWTAFLSGFCGCGYAAADAVVVGQMQLIRDYLGALPWWELVPDLGDGSFFSPSDGAVCSCAAKGEDFYVFYFGGTNTLTGGIKRFDAEHAYVAQWFNPRKGEFRAKTTLPGAAGGEIPLPRKPDAKDWVLCVRRIDAVAPKAIATKESARARGLFDWNRAKNLSKGVKLLALDEEVDTPLESGDAWMVRKAEEQFGRTFRGKRQMKSYLVRVDLKMPGIGFAATGRDKDWGKPMPPDPEGRNKDLDIRTLRKTTGEFMAQVANTRLGGVARRPLIGFNTGTWGPWPEPKHFYASPNGLAISEGVTVMDVKKAPEAVFVIWRDGTMDVTGEFPLTRTNEVWIAHTGRSMLMEGGRDSVVDPGSNGAKLLPRMALGLSKDRDYLYLLAIDGRRPGWSMGGVAKDMTRIFRAAGAWDAIDFDGNSASLCDWDRHKSQGVPVNKSSSPRVALSITVYQDLSKGRKKKEK